MTKFMEQFHQENRHQLDLSLMGSLFALMAGASGGLMFGLMTGRSWERDFVLMAAGGLLMACMTFVMLYLHLLGQQK
jgi:hypothetical protein